MDRLPASFLNSLKSNIGFDRDAFIHVHESGEQVTSIRIHPVKGSLQNGISGQVPWSALGYYLQQRPSFTFDPLFHAGCYYVQEASSMFLEQPFVQLVNRGEPIKVLDLCAAPGGKSTHIQSLISPDSVLVSNEVIRNRSLALIDNILKWGPSNVIVTNNDPSAFKKLEGYFDVIVVDAPCSGSGLFRRDASAIEEWSLNNVQLCCQRQQRILADALPALKQDGLLVYSTCSYSREEDEDISDWLIHDMDMENVELVIDDKWNIVKTYTKAGATGYRFYPDKLSGEGFYLACFRKKNPTSNTKLKIVKPEKAGSKDKAITKPWLREAEMEIIVDRDRLFAISIPALQVYSELKNVLNILYKGIELGQIMKGRLVPAHGLALSMVYAESLPFTELEYAEAIKYLQRQEFNFNSSGKGWQFARYKGHNLGWINVLSNRANNYYPKELRILKQSIDAIFEK